MGFDRVFRYNESDCRSDQFPLFLQDHWDSVSPRTSRRQERDADE
jgi:hypothetical protein